MRLQYAANIRIIKIPCTGRLAVIHMLRALERGADGVLISGCLLGDCHYRNGNNRAVKRVAFVKELVGKIGIDPRRVEMYFNSSAMGPQFAQCCNDFTDLMRKLGPGLRASTPVKSSTAVS
jgi:coenzyme F420-reducing hydrogenase delta subunit